MKRIGGYEIVGSIAVVDGKKGSRAVAEEILRRHKQVRSVYAKEEGRVGEFRVMNLRLIAGEDNAFTLYKENGCRYYVDLKKVYFSPRLAHERARVAADVKAGERVLVLFAGVGPFAIPIAKKTRTIANELNPEAVNLLKKNALLNKVDLEVHEGDAKDALKRYKADRIIMPLPHSAHLFLADAFKALDVGGIIHFYTIVERDNGLEEALEKAKIYAHCPFTLKNWRVVNNYSPAKIQIVLDLEKD